jgi:hypothetical protein
MHSARSVAYSIAVATAALSASHASAQPFTQQAQALSLIEDTADRICQSVATHGSATSTAVRGQVNAQVNGLARSLVDIGAGGGGSHTTTQWNGLLAGDLPLALRDSIVCRQHVFDSLRGLLLTSPPPVRAIHSAPSTTHHPPPSTHTEALPVDPLRLHLTIRTLGVDSRLVDSECEYQLLRAAQANNLVLTPGASGGLAYTRNNVKVFMTCPELGRVAIGVASATSVHDVAVEGDWAEALVRTVMAQPQ